MSRQKTRKFKENLERENIIQSGKDLFDRIRGNWNKEFFGNSNPICIEIGCGRGEYTIGLAQEFPETNFVGIDIKGDRIWKGSGQAIDLGLKNVGFLRTDIRELDNFFLENEVAEIWITFPDPRPKKRDQKRRLTHPIFMSKYAQILKRDGWVKFKTDNTDLFQYTIELIEENQISVRNLISTMDLYNSELMVDHFGVVTKYERLFHEKGELIKYMKFQFDYDSKT